jgi:hypothetical protein
MPETMFEVCWWRLKAEEVRTTAQDFRSASAKQSMEDVARTWDRMANDLEKRLSEKQKNDPFASDVLGAKPHKPSFLKARRGNLVCSFNGEGMCDRFYKLQRRTAGRSPLIVLVTFPHQFDDAIDGFEHLFVRDDALLHEQMQDALAKHQADLAVAIKRCHCFLFF